MKKAKPASEPASGEITTFKVRCPKCRNLRSFERDSSGLPGIEGQGLRYYRCPFCRDRIAVQTGPDAPDE